MPPVKCMPQLKETQQCQQMIVHRGAKYKVRFMLPLQVPKEDAPSIPPEYMAKFNISAEVMLYSAVHLCNSTTLHPDHLTICSSEHSWMVRV